MIILGINDGHDASATVLVDGVIVAAIAEERFTRRKLEIAYPEQAVQRCLALAGLTTSDIDHVAVSTLNLPPWFYFIRREPTFSVSDYYREQYDYWHPLLIEGKKLSYIDVFADKARREEFAYDWSLISDEYDTNGMRAARQKLIGQRLGLPPQKISFYDHHSCHAYYAYFSRPRPSTPSLVYTCDGSGDGSNGTIWIARPDAPLELISRTPLCNIARIYQYATLLLGMKPGEHEFKVMGLAPYAHPRHGEAAYKVYAETLQVDGLDFTYKVKPKDHFFHFQERLRGMRFDNIAYGVQKRTEELVAEWIVNGIRKTGIRDIVLTGGVAQNVKANKKAFEHEEVGGLYVPPGPGDESLSVGAAIWAYVNYLQSSNQSFESIRPIGTAYLGHAPSKAQIDRAIENGGLQQGCVIRRGDPATVADLLAGGDVVARFGGRMEFGPRALGNRSILADPRRRQVVQVINDTVKHRDFWMPFAPSVLAEHADEYFVNPRGIEARFMTMSFDTTPLGRESLAAAVHPSDATCRPQELRREDNPEYHAIVSAFRGKTGVAAVLNTSFNLHGEAIVGEPDHAVSTFNRCDLRHLLLGDTLISKPAQ